MKEICPICDGIGFHWIKNNKTECWGCKGSGIVHYYEESIISEPEIKNMLLVLNQK